MLSFVVILSSAVQVAQAMDADTKGYSLDILLESEILGPVDTNRYPPLLSTVVKQTSREESRRENVDELLCHLIHTKRRVTRKN